MYPGGIFPVGEGEGGLRLDPEKKFFGKFVAEKGVLDCKGGVRPDWGPFKKKFSGVDGAVSTTAPDGEGGLRADR